MTFAERHPNRVVVDGQAASRFSNLDCATRTAYFLAHPPLNQRKSTTLLRREPKAKVLPTVEIHTPGVIYSREEIDRLMADLEHRIGSVFSEEREEQVA